LGCHPAHIRGGDMMKLEIPTIVLIVLVLVFSLLFAFWVDDKRKRPTMRQVDRTIFDGVK